MTHSRGGQKNTVTVEQEGMQLKVKDMRMVVTVILHGLRGVGRGNRMETATL